MTFDDWCARYGDYLNDSDDAAKAARLMARRAWDAADRERSELRARAERAEAERDALRAALDCIVLRLQMDVNDGSRPDQWTMEYLIRTAKAALPAGWVIGAA